LLASEQMVNVMNSAIEALPRSLKEVLIYTRLRGGISRKHARC
jgi:hypothetical protein